MGLVSVREYDSAIRTVAAGGDGIGCCTVPVTSHAHMPFPCAVTMLRTDKIRRSDLMMKCGPSLLDKHRGKVYLPAVCSNVYAVDISCQDRGDVCARPSSDLFPLGAGHGGWATLAMQRWPCTNDRLCACDLCASSWAMEYGTYGNKYSRRRSTCTTLPLRGISVEKAGIEIGMVGARDTSVCSTPVYLCVCVCLWGVGCGCGVWGVGCKV
jgi:hypothetical protein